MNLRYAPALVIAALLFSSPVIVAANSGSEKALWIVVTEKGDKVTTIAMTEGIARRFVESTNFHFSEKGKSELITRKMLKSVLDGDEETVNARDDENGSEAKVYMHGLRVPANKGGRDHLVLETRKAGEKNFRITLPQIEMESSDEDGIEYIKTSFGWKNLLPFLSTEGGAIYLRTDNDDTEIWLYVE